MVHLKGQRFGKYLFCKPVGFKINIRLMPVCIYYLKRLPVNVQTDKDSYLFDGFKGLVKLMEPAGAEVPDQDVKVPDVLEGLSESVKKCGTGVVCEKCKVCLHKFLKLTTV